MDYQKYLKDMFQEKIELLEIMKMADTQKIEDVADVIVKAYRRGNKLMVFGNGGSAADAQHFVAEMEGRFKMERHPLPALAFTCNTSTLTAIANDYGFDSVFTRPLRAHAKYGDIVVGISTSGNSPNVVKAIDEANKLDLETIALTGGKQSALSRIADYNISIGSNYTPTIQEGHITVIHMLCDLIERKLFR